jgi:hypothetical protein
MSEFAARWLFGDGKVEGIPFASGAAVPREQAGRLPSFLSAPERSTPSHEPRAEQQPAPRLRGQVREGRPVRLSPTAVPASSPSADSGLEDKPSPSPETVEEPAGPQRQIVARAAVRASEPTERIQPARRAPAPILIQLKRSAAEDAAGPDPLTIVWQAAGAPEEVAVEAEAPATTRPKSFWRAAFARVTSSRPSRPERAQPGPSTERDVRIATPPVRRFDPAPQTPSEHAGATAAGPRAQDARAPEQRPWPNAPPVSASQRPALLRVRRTRSASPDVTARQAGVEPIAGQTAGGRLARATGAALSGEDNGGLETIEFGALASRPRPTAALIAPNLITPTVAAPDPLAPASTDGDAPAADTTAVLAIQSLTAVADVPHAAASPDVDELYEHLVERLRRDLLHERERMGDLLGDLP